MTNRLIVTVALLAAVTARADEPMPQVAPFPLDVVRAPTEFTKKDREDLQKLLPMLVRAARVEVPDAARLSMALNELKRQDCDRDDSCLAQLAKLAGSLYGLFIQLDYDLEGRVVVTGRVVRDDGKVMREPKTIRLTKSKSHFRDVARSAISDLLVALDVAHLSPFRPKEEVAAKPPDPVKAAEAIVKPPETKTVTERHSLYVTPAVVATGAGVACLISGAVLLGTSSVRTDTNGNVFREDAARVAGVQSNQTVGAVLITAGVVLAGAGVGWLVFGPEEVTTTIVPLGDGAAVMVTGVLP